MDVDKVSTCCKILFDRRILEQRREIERLKLENFWLKHGKRALHAAMQNYNHEVTKCACAICCVSGRFDCDEDDTPESVDEDGYHGYMTFDCKFIPEFNRLLSKHQLIVSHGPYNMCVRPILPDDGQGEPVCADCDAHFGNAGRRDWVVFAIGKRLWSAPNVSSELVNYRNMMDELGLHRST
jgi:hypothetical protein